MAYDMKRDVDSDYDYELGIAQEKVETMRLAALEMAGLGDTAGLPGMQITGLNIRFGTYGVNVTATVKTHRFLRTHK